MIFRSLAALYAAFIVFQVWDLFSAEDAKEVFLRLIIMGFTGILFMVAYRGTR